jgi:hypothetical protein
LIIATLGGRLGSGRRVEATLVAGFFVAVFFTGFLVAIIILLLLQLQKISRKGHKGKTNSYFVPLCSL